jgi:uncharacterized membrane protein YkvA (DUF1232 family)
MKICFELSPSDIRYFRDRLKQVRASDGSHDESVVIGGAANLVEEALTANPPQFVVERIGTLERLIGMLRDREWRLEGRDRRRILDALAYFVDPDDLIPDRIPGIGYLDDAIMVELIALELKHEIEAYDDFCAYRDGAARKEGAVRLETRRDALQARMRRRRRRAGSLHGSRRASSRTRLGLW